MNTPRTFLHFTALMLLSVSTIPCAFAAERKPNVILVFSDDHGYADLGAQGADRDIRTPNLDQLARDGVRFARGYVTAPQCVPSRAGVITGRYQQKFGVEDNQKGPLPLAELTIAERLAPAGYISCQVGKWHLEPPPRGSKHDGLQYSDAAARAFLPLGQGFAEYYTGPMNSFVASHDLAGAELPDAPGQLADKRFRCLWQTDAALSFISRHANDPFFLYLAYFAPHVPLDSPEPWFSQTPSQLPKERRQALAMIGAMDDGIGRLRAKLHELGIERDTLIFFIGDNGAPLSRGAWDGSLNSPLVGEKGMLTDGGIRTPFVAAWPGKFSAGRTFEYPVSSLDVAATAIALAGQPPDEKLDGVNLTPFITGESEAAPHESLYWRWRTQAAVLEFPWKLIRLGPKERYLFDTTMPDGETKNLLTQHPEIAARLHAKLQKWTETLQPPGLPTETNGQDEHFFDDHVKRPFPGPIAAANEERLPESDVQGWFARNATLAVKDGALILTPDPKVDPNARPFFVRAKLAFSGPVTAVLRIRAEKGGASNIAWRSSDEADFVSGNVAAFDWPSSTEWREVQVSIPVRGKLAHLRISPPRGSRGIAVQSIALRGADGESQTWRFDGTHGKN